MFKTDQVLVGLNRMTHLARLEVFEGLNEQQSEELANLSFTLSDVQHNPTFDMHPQTFDYGMDKAKAEEPVSAVREISSMIEAYRYTDHRQLNHNVIIHASEIIRKINAPGVTQSDADAAIIRMSQQFSSSSIHPFLSSVGSFYTVYPLPTHILQREELKKWTEQFYDHPSIERLNKLHKTLEDEDVLGTEFVPFYENNFSKLHDKICGILWSINSATLLIHFAAGVLSKGFLDTVKDALDEDHLALPDLSKYQKDIYNDVVKLSEARCNENVVDLRCILLLNILDAFMEVTNEK